MLDVPMICLGMLSHRDFSGYELKKFLVMEGFGDLAGASFGSIYPALAKLATDGLIQGRFEVQDKRPDKKVFSITEMGRQFLRDRLKTPPAPDRLRSEFFAYLFFAAHVAPDMMPGLLDGQIADQRQKLAELKTRMADSQCPLGPIETFMANYALTTLTASLAYFEANKALIDALGASQPASVDN